MNKVGKKSSTLQRLGDLIRPSISINREIVAATNAAELGELFDTSYNAKIGVLGKTNDEVDRLFVIAEKLLKIVPKEKLSYVNFLIVDNNMDLRKEVFASQEQLKKEFSPEEIEDMKRNAVIFLSQVIQKGCILYAQNKDKNWNKDELRNELEKMKEHVLRSVAEKTDISQQQQKMPTKPLLFSKKKDVEIAIESTGNLINSKSNDEPDKDDRAKLLFTAPRARENSLPADLIKDMMKDDGKTYSFLDLLAADGYETNDLEIFEEQIILKLDKLKDHLLHQFNPVFNELNSVKKRLQHLSEKSHKEKDDRRSIMKPEPK